MESRIGRLNTTEDKKLVQQIVKLIELDQGKRDEVKRIINKNIAKKLRMGTIYCVHQEFQ